MDKVEKWRNNKTGDIYWELCSLVDATNEPKYGDIVFYTKVITWKDLLSRITYWIKGYKHPAKTFFFRESGEFIDKFTPLDIWKMNNYL
ncbi:hypothetical protein LCGC14_0245960 [marine sediment metagenome]|uniref:Uncharacterized protein n=1 Tax=marine sediment metagenome TaxID=412755 RepID=A0A0F9U657_9ZZZZ